MKRFIHIAANKAQNYAEMNDISQEFARLQEAKDRVRPFFNNAPSALKRQSTSELRAAAREQRNRERNSARELAN